VITVNDPIQEHEADSLPIRPQPLDELSIAELAVILVREKRTLAKVVLAAAVLSTVTAFVIPRKFTAEAVIFTPRQQQSSFSAMVQLSGMSGGGGMGGGGSLGGLDLLSGLGFRNSADLYMGVLHSRTIQDRIISRFDLKKVYDAEDFYSARKRLARNTSIKSGKDTLIHILVEDRDAKRSAELANAYVEELARQGSEVTLSEAVQRRVFFESQLKKEKEILADSEIAMRNTQQTTGLIVPTGQATALLRSAAQLRAEILSRQAQLEGMTTFVTDDNPRLQRVKRELSVLEEELAKLKGGSQFTGTPEVPANLLPQAALEYIRRSRDVKYHETLFEILAKQYEAARLDEAKMASAVQIVDRAVTPERKSWPPRVLLILGSTIFAAAGAAFYIWARQARQPRAL
jgi:tyrosine-protein kinase Etk/Wzc